MNLAASISSAVLLRIAELKSQGSPDLTSITDSAEIVKKLSTKGEILLYGGGKPGECAEMFNAAAHAIAVLAFLPGGVRLFGCHFEANVERDEAIFPELRGRSPPPAPPLPPAPPPEEIYVTDTRPEAFDVKLRKLKRGRKLERK